MPPLLLAGPIVRRVDAASASVWVALSSPATVELHVWPGAQTSVSIGAVAGNAAVVANGRASTRRFGEHLYIAVVRAVWGVGEFLPGVVCSYDVSFTANDQPFPDAHLLSLGLLRDETPGDRLEGVDAAAPLHLALGYTDDTLPSFVTPPATIDQLRLAHASCRKTNAAGTDALAFLDDTLSESINGPDRPQQLFLTGDQIYADDLGACLLPMLSEIGAELVGGIEELPTGVQADPASNAPTEGTLANFPAGCRQGLVAHHGRFTSTAAANHLLTFGEFAAMYCAAWSPRVWRTLASADDVFTGNGPQYFDAKAKRLEPAYDDLDAWTKDATAGFTTETAAVERYRHLVPRVARVLANVATYMILDDHEVTDDFNLNLAWRRRVLTRRFGRAVLRNGLMAFAVFQAWGNEPAAFSRPEPVDDVGAGNFDAEGWATSKNGRLLKAAASSFADAAPFPNGGVELTTTIDELLGLGNPDSPGAADATVRFHFRVPGPRHEVIVLDTRIHRTYPGGADGSPALLGDTLESQIPAGPLPNVELVVVVSPPPVVGPTLVFAVGQSIAQLMFDARASIWDPIFGDPKKVARNPSSRLTGAEQYDAEGWGGNDAAFEALLARLAGHPTVVLLSGDVHFAGTATLDYWKTADRAVSKIIQLTSSGARNPMDAALSAALRSGPFLQQALQGLPTERLGWTKDCSIVVPTGSRIGPGRRSRMKRKPAVVTSSGWPPGTTIPTDKQPEWRWRLRVVRDERTSAELPIGSPRLDPIPEYDNNSMMSGYGEVAGRHSKAALKRLTPLRIAVFTSNVGTIAVEPDGGAHRVVHTLLSETSESSDLGAAYTVHRTSLATSADAPPQLREGP